MRFPPFRSHRSLLLLQKAKGLRVAHVFSLPHRSPSLICVTFLLMFVGGPFALHALQGLFVLITEHNLYVGACAKWEER